MLEVAALLHDIGKVGVPDNILLKPGALTEEEWEVMRRNDIIGKEIIRASFGFPQLTAIVEHYQAHFGNPEVRPSSPVGTRIPVSARILAIADAYDAMTTDRVFRKGRKPAEAVAELRRCAGTQFDPELVERFVSVIRGRPFGDSIHQRSVSKETALVIGLQLERLSDVLDEQDFDSLEAISQRLQLIECDEGADRISDKATKLKKILDNDRDPHSILQVANELLDLCRSTQQAFIESESAGEVAEVAAV